MARITLGMRCVAVPLFAVVLIAVVLIAVVLILGDRTLAASRAPANCWRGT